MIHIDSLAPLLEVLRRAGCLGTGKARTVYASHYSVEDGALLKVRISGEGKITRITKLNQADLSRVRLRLGSQPAADCRRSHAA